MTKEEEIIFLLIKKMLMTIVYYLELCLLKYTNIYFITLQDVDNDIESIGSEGAVNYYKLIQQTIARKRRSRILRLICAVFTFCVVIGVVVVLVLFVGQKQS